MKLDPEAEQVYERTCFSYLCILLHNTASGCHLNRLKQPKMSLNFVENMSVRVTIKNRPQKYFL